MNISRHLFLVPMVALVQTAWAQDTAYQALRTFGAANDQALLNRIVEVKGRSGAPQPNSWLLVVDDPKARGGIREVEIAGGKITSERTPVQAYGGSAADSTMDMSRLNLDSQGAYTVAEDEARNAGVNFSSVDYVLRRDDNSGAPMWVLQLLDEGERGVGTIRISADNGAVISREFGREAVARGTPQDNRGVNTPPPATASRPDRSSSRPRSSTGRPQRPPETTYEESGNRSIRRQAQGEYEGDRYASEREDRDDRPGSPVTRGAERVERYYEKGERRGKDIGHRINRRVHRIGGALQHFFTGKRTVDDEFRGPYDDVD